MGRSSHSPDRREGGTGDPALPRTGGPALPRTGGPALARTGGPALPPSMRDRVPFLLFRASAMSLALANEMLARLALNARHVGILTMVTEREPMTQKELSDALGIDRTTMVALLDDLEEKGYVARQRHPRDRRAFLVHPTQAGRRVKETAVRILDEQQRQFLTPLTAAECEQLATLLQRLLAPREAPRPGPDPDR